MVTSAADGPVPFLLRTRFVVLLTLLAMVAIGVAVALHQHSRGRWVLATEHRVLPPALMRADLDKAYTIDLRAPWMSRRAKTYPARLLEDGRDLGPAVADRAKLRAEGGGRLLLWEGELSFSSSDGTDPRRNGRRYELVWPMPLPPFAMNGIKILAVLLGLVAACAVTRWWRRNPEAGLPRRLGPLVWRAHASLGSQEAKGHWRACLLVGLVAIAIRLIALALVHANPADHITGLLVMGVQFSDAQGWDRLGESVMRGDGLAGGWSARRPFLACVLGALYTWTGPMPAAVVLMNVVLCGWTAALVCRIGQRVAHPIAGLVAGLAFAFDPVSIEYSHYVATETPGTFLFVLSLRSLIDGVQKNRVSSCCQAGVLFALSNLTRTLTLPAAPFLALAALFGGHRQSGSWRRGLALATVFCVGLGLPLGAWIVRQKVVHDITTISDNTASGLYAAASPKFGSWNSAIDREADDAGIPGDIKSRYDWFMQRFREELRADPAFYVDNVRHSAAIAFTNLANLPEVVPWLLVLMLTAVWLSRLPSFASHWRLLLPWLLVLAGIGYAIFAMTRTGFLVLAAFGIVAAIVQQRERLALLLLATFLCTILAVALFALGDDPRLLLMVSWMMPLVIAHGVLVLLALAARGLGDRGMRAWTIPATGPTYTPRWQTIAVRGLVACFVASLLVVAWRTFVSPLPPLATPRHPTVAEASAFARRVAELRPGSVTPAELASPQTWYHQVDGPDPSPAHGRLVVATLRLARHRYPLLADMEVGNHYSRMFVKRPYERLFTYADLSLLPDSGSGPNSIVLPPPWPGSADRDIVVLGRANVDRAYVYEENYLEVLAWAPLLPDGTADLDALQVTTAAPHEALVRSLAR